MDTPRKMNEEMKSAGRLPPGQTVTEKFPVLHYGPVPKFDPATWSFHVWGEVSQMLTLTWDEFSALPRTKITMDLHCVTRWSKMDTLWEGVSLKTLISEGLVELKPEANYVIQHAEFGYTTNLPLSTALQDNFLLATHYNGAPLTPDHGYPLRGVIGAIPGKSGDAEPYLWKGAKWLRGLEFKRSDQPGFWELAGYHNNADVWREQRFE